MPLAEPANSAVPAAVIQLGLSRWWLARFRFGPLEWLWRRLMYGR